MAHNFAKWHLPRFGRQVRIPAEVSPDFQLYLLCVDQMNQLGHVHFDTVGDLEAALPHLNRSALKRAAAALRAAGMLAPGSGLKTFVVASDKASHGLRKRGRNCPSGCDGRFWYDDTWVHPDELEYGSHAANEWAQRKRVHI